MHARMTGHMKRNNSKGMAIIGWVLLVAFTISASLLVINWTKQRTEVLTEGTVKYVEGRLACQSVRLANISTTCPNQVILKNIGMLNIIKVIAQIDDKTSETKPIDLKAQGDNKMLTTSNPFKNLTVIPLIMENKELVGCKEKKVIVHC